MEIICISDTHLAAPLLHPADLLIHAGDMTYQGTQKETTQTLEWFRSIRHQFDKIVVVPGNHELGWEADFLARKADFAAIGVDLLYDEAVEYEGLSIWGSPVQPRFFDWEFNRNRGADIKQHWDKIPLETNILITHGPPFGIGDLTPRGEHVGCQDLLDKVRSLPNLRLHVFGHIHEGRGVTLLNGVSYVNACIMDGRYRPVHGPIVINL